ncbi:MAG: ImmA/IrrE family metallo-endopeptidase [Burkholderiales bacterium]
MTRIPINPDLLTWARERAGLDTSALAGRFPKLAKWESGELQPTLRQIEDFARAVHTPVGFLFLPTPPQEPLPIPDFRTLVDRAIVRPSPNLLDAIYLCQQRQDWFREHARVYALPVLAFVGSVRMDDAPEGVAEAMRQALDLSIWERQRLPTWTDALRQLISKAEDAGVLVMASGVVGSNSHRRLDVTEFRGFALADDLAPLVFLNAADSKAAQMFTLAHEIAHLWLGQSGVSDPEAGQLPAQGVERWCNAVAAEFLLPLAALRREYRANEPVAEEIQRLARSFKVSTLVALRRLFDAGVHR